MGCATGLVKAIMFIFNFLFVLAGLGLIAIGVLFYVKMQIYKEVIDYELQMAPTLVLIVGVIVFIIAFFGCCGVLRDSHCMLVTYAVLLLTLFAIQLGIGIYAYLQVNETGELQPVIKENLQKVFNRYKESREAKELFEVLQRELHCCGVNSALDYRELPPGSCCGRPDTDSCQIEIVKEAFRPGCAQASTKAVESNILILAYVAGGIAITEILGAIFSFCLASTLKNESRRRYP